MNKASLTCTAVLAFVSLFANAQQAASSLAPGYYVILGTFRESENAAKFLTSLQAGGVKARVAFDTSNSLHYVCGGQHTDKSQAIEQVLSVRSNLRHNDAWVKSVVAQDQTAAYVAPVIQEEVPETNDAIASEPESELKAIPIDDITLGNTEIFLSLFNAANDRVIQGEVSVVDAERGKLIKKVKGNDYLTLPDPKNKSGNLLLICEAFGYRKVQHTINYKEPLQDSTKAFVDLMGTNLVASFNMTRMAKGEIAVLFNVFYFNDAEVMMPESLYELNELQSMMTENPKLAIMLHGHTNGNSVGKIICMGEEKNFFSLTGTKSITGSAKDLSFRRASIIKEYLVSKGIPEARIGIKSWGGKKPLYDKHSNSARKNVRVEVEIIAQ